MKYIVLAVSFLFISNLSAQNYFQSDKYSGTLAELYLHRQPSAKAEAMGMGSVANNDADFGSYYNPALTSLSNGVTVNTSFSNPYYLATKSKFNYFGASYSDKKLGSFGLSRYFWTLGEDIIITNEMGVETGTLDSYNFSLYSLNYSREIINDFFAGVNLGIAHIHFPVPPSEAFEFKDAFTIDIGLLKKVTLDNPSKNVKHSVSFGASVINISGSKIKATYEGTTEDNLLPIVIRAGGNYNIKIKGNSLIPGGNLFESLTHVEYRNVTNSDYYKTFSIGEEFTLSDIFILRLGYFSQTVEQETIYNVGSQSKFTYGAGVKLPLNKIFKMNNTLNLGIDYVNMTPPSFSKTYTDWDNFQTLGVSLKWIP